MDTKGKKIAGPTDHLANERTFLAWVRTGIALMGFGFVIVKFALFIRQISIMLVPDKQIPVQGKGYSAVIGVVMVALGALMIALAYIRYRNIEKQLHNNDYYPSGWLAATVTFSLIAGAVLLVLYLVPNINV